MSTNQEQIETAARAIAGKYGYRYDGLSVADKKWYADTAIAVLEAIHPTVSSVDELDALPSGSVILANGGEDSAQNDGDGDWYYWGNDCPFYARDIRLPATVLHIPGGAA